MSYLYGELSAGACTDLNEHLRTCSDCTAAVNGWQMARKNLDAWKPASRKAHRHEPLL